MKIGKTFRIGAIKIGSLARSASGNQSITGVGFRPAVIYFLAQASGGTHQIACVGFDNKDAQHSISFWGDDVDTRYSILYSIYARIDGANYATGKIASFDADGFTITWDFNGTLTVTVNYLAMR